jgi:hypothetical protein
MGWCWLELGQTQKIFGKPVKSFWFFIKVADIKN